MRQHDAGGRILADVLALRPFIAEVRDEIERTRVIPPALLSALRATGVFHMWMPEALGGPELSITAFAEVAEALSYADSAVGWCCVLAQLTRASPVFCRRPLLGRFLMATSLPEVSPQPDGASRSRAAIR